MLRKIVVLCALLMHTVVYADTISEEQHRSVIVRKIGHEILLMTGDSTSRVLPVTVVDERYVLRFESEFAFEPELLSGTVKRVMEEVRLQHSYLVEVFMCEKQTMVYNFEGGGYQHDSLDLMPCATRAYPKTCYELAITFGESNKEKQELSVSGEHNLRKESGVSHWWWITIVVVVVIALIFLFRKREETQEQQEHIINIGAYVFDKRNMHLTFRDETVELTSKEADLLFLLHSSANQTIERDTILRIVWGDDGDYVGRTLDVFISKLRKKLAADPAIKITNIRGVGYRLVVDVPGI